MSQDPFDAAYYRRYYEDPTTQVRSEADAAHLAAGIVHLIEWWGYPLRSVIDVGAGTGAWGAWLARERPDVRVRSVDVSAYACATYGHELRDISRWHDDEEHDLVICQGVLAYLDDDACARAVENLASMSRNFLYVAHRTEEDVQRGVLDSAGSDPHGYLRPVRFYTGMLQDWYRPIGAGLWQAHGAQQLLLALERP